MVHIQLDYTNKSDDDLSFVSSALQGDILTGKAPIVGDYEAALAHFFRCRNAIAVSSGSTAIQAALYCLGVRAGDEVLVPALSVLPTVFPISASGAKIVPVDVSGFDLGFDLDDLKSKISQRTKAAIVAPLWGYPLQLTETLRFLADQDIPLIEDAAHAHGSRVSDKRVGTFGTVGCFSTHDRKLLATGEGGFLLTDSDHLASELRSFTRLRGLDGETWGVNYRFNALASGLGISRLKKLEKQIDHRQRNAAIILQKIQDSGSVSELTSPEQSYLNYYNLNRPGFTGE